MDPEQSSAPHDQVGQSSETTAEELTELLRQIEERKAAELANKETSPQAVASMTRETYRQLYEHTEQQKKLGEAFDIASTIQDASMRERAFVELAVSYGSVDEVESLNVLAELPDRGSMRLARMEALVRLSEAAENTVYFDQAVALANDEAWLKSNVRIVPEKYFDKDKAKWRTDTRYQNILGQRELFSDDARKKLHVAALALVSRYSGNREVISALEEEADIGRSSIAGLQPHGEEYLEAAEAGSYKAFAALNDFVDQAKDTAPDNVDWMSTTKRDVAETIGPRFDRLKDALIEHGFPVDMIRRSSKEEVDQAEVVYAKLIKQMAYEEIESQSRISTGNIALNTSELEGIAERSRVLGDEDKLKTVYALLS